MHEKPIDELSLLKEQLRFQFESMGKAIDDIAWQQKLGDAAEIRRFSLIGPAPKNTTAQAAQDKGNPLVVYAYTLVPHNLDRSKKHPLLVWVHGGVHAHFHSNNANMMRELLEQGYIIIAPDYRGSTGYGEVYWKLIDYGALEVEDAFAARNWAVENLDFVDPDRVGIMGWSHGGMISLMNVFLHPENYRVAYAGVPVSDLVARMGYKGPNYEKLFSADYHIGKSAWEDPAEYRRRSPAWHAEKLQTPLLVHTTTNDEDVNVLEVEHLIKALKAHGKEFEYKIYDNAPGGHVFNRIDTKEARESRQEIYAFLQRYLKPGE
ncbi:MAG TPA: alpha/beta fold hydrolase [Bacillota bacterium]|nr:alpha/beta fold hydrolase [Bacillota bacterium]